MGSPFEGNQNVEGIYSNEYGFFMHHVPQQSTGARNTDQVNTGYTQMISDTLQSWSTLPDTGNDSNTYAGGDQIFNDPSSTNTLFDPSGSSTNQWVQISSPVSTAPSVHMSDQLSINEQHVPKRPFDPSTDRSQSNTVAKRRKRNEQCETPRSQRILTDYLDTLINEIVLKVQPKMNALATLSEMEVRELSEHFIDRLRQRFLGSALQNTQFGVPRSTTSTVECSLRTRPYQSTREPIVDDLMLSTPVQSTPVQSSPKNLGFPLATRPRRKTRLKSNRKIVPCCRTRNENLLERDEKRRYQCTRKCGKRFKRKDDWKRHELKACPQDGWLCMVGMFYEQDGEPLCRFCRAPCTSADHFRLAHPGYMQSRPSWVQNGSSCGKLFVSNRKDHFRQHFDCRHSDLFANFEKLEEMSHFRILYEGEWRCGFCPPQNGFDDWNAWCNHVANHFENGKSIKDWLDYTERPRAVSQHAVSEDDASSDEDDNNGGEGPSRTNGNSHKEPPDLHSDSSDFSDDDDETPRGGGAGEQNGSYGFWQTGKGTCRVQVLRGSSEFDQISVASVNSMDECSELSTRTKNSRGILKHREESQRTEMSASGGGKNHPPFKENGSTGSLPEARVYRAFERIKVLGTGSFSIVDEVLHLPTRLRCARKTSRADQHQHLLVESRTLQQLRHQHIVRLLDSFSVGAQFSLLLAPVADMNLAEYLEMATRFTLECRGHLKRFLSCLISAMIYVHESSLTHGDIKPSNILVTKEPSPNVLLCDFGAARKTTDSIEWTNHGRPLTWKYCAPEVVARQCRGTKADIWSLGCVFLEISNFLFAENCSKLQDFRAFFSGKFFYHKELAKISDWLKYFQSRSATTESHIPETIRSMLDSIPLRRPSAANLLSRFPPAPCCLAEPMTSLCPVSSFDALYDLAIIRSVPELTKRSRSCLTTFTLDTEALEKICSEFTRLTLAQYRLQAGISGIQLCKSWLQICTASHQRCTHNGTGGFTPTRLLEISFGSKPILTLRSLTEFPGMKPQYVALSYVWDSDNHMFQLGKSLFQNHTIDIDKLPPNLAKAISAINLLGHRYLWIDSLCINQDDIEKRCFTIRNMTQIYQNADVMLMFSGSESVRHVRDEMLTQSDSGSSHIEDFVSEQLEFPRHDVPLYRRDVDLANSSLKHGRPMSHCRYCPTRLSDNNLQSMQALTRSIRAWTLHSSLLSKRRIVLTDDDVQWECQVLRASGTFPRGLDPYIWESIYGKWDQRISRCACRYPQTSPRSNLLSLSTDMSLYDFWAVVVTQYTSKASDDLRGQTSAYVGLLPVAEKMKKVIKDNFLVGLWEKSLSWSLLWKVDSLFDNGGDGEELIHKQGKSQVFPSWSWAGLTGTVRIPRHTHGVSLITVLKAGVTGEEEYSVPDRLILRGPVSSTKLAQSSDAALPMIQLDLPRSSQAQPNLVRVVPHFDNGPDMAWRLNDLFAIWVWLALPTSTSGPVIGGILLRKAEEDENNIFKRCGTLELAELPFTVNGDLDDSAVDLGFLEGLIREITIL